MGGKITEIDTVSLDEANKALVIIDQTKLPGQIQMLSLTKAKEIWDAIYLLQVRGAPAIGVAAAIGMYVLASRYEVDDYDAFYAAFCRDKEYLDSSRPTAVNLSWALKRMEGVVTAHANEDIPAIVDALHQEAMVIRDEDIAVCHKIGEYGMELLKPGDGVLTHCNAGKLATVRFGTATAPIYLAEENDYHLHVFCDETRPLLQGARLTAFELKEDGIPVILQTDSMAAYAMQQGLIDAVIVGADRITKEGDVANKIGTYGLAVLAKAHGIPFYVAAPYSTFDFTMDKGEDIPIEMRNPEEVWNFYHVQTGPEGVDVLNPAFDVTPHDLITAIITERGVLQPDYRKSIEDLKSQIQG